VPLEITCPLKTPQVKREQLKKEGKLLTKKQKEEQRAAEIRKQALLASGVVIEGLQQQQAGGSAGASKKFSYGGKKKKGPQTGTSTKESTPISTPSVATKALPPEPELSPPTPDEKPAETKDEWDAESEEEKTPAPAADVKSDWDASSEDEKPAPKPAVQPKGTYASISGSPNLTTLVQPYRRPHPRRRRPRRSHQLKHPPSPLLPAKPRLGRNLSRGLHRSRRRYHLHPPLLLRTLQTQILMIPMKIPTKVSPRRSRWLLRRRLRRPRGEPRLTKLLWLPGIRTIYEVPSVVFSDTSIPERRSFWTRYVTATGHPLESREHSLTHASDQTNKRSGGRGWWYHTTNRSHVLPRGRYQDQDRRSQ